MSQASEQPPSALGAVVSERDAYLRRNLLRGLLSLVALFALMVVASAVYERELLAFTHRVNRALGLPGLAALLFCADSVTAPLPPDVLLVVVAKTDLALRWSWLVPLGGALSALAGTAGWALGTRLGQHGAVAPAIARLRTRHGAAVERYDRLTVALGALTPLPFSITCWSAGAVGMPLLRFLPVTLLRIPRYVVYYLAIVYADQLARQL